MFADIASGSAELVLVTWLTLALHATKAAIECMQDVI